MVLVATVRALKYNGGIPKAELAGENLTALEQGIVNLGAHNENMQKYGLPVGAAINRFGTDTDAELSYVEDYCKQQGVAFSLCEVFAKGGAGGTDLAEKVVETIERADGSRSFAPIYDTASPIKEKIAAIAEKINGASGVTYTPRAEREIQQLTALGFDKIPVCMAKTQ